MSKVKDVDKGYKALVQRVYGMKAPAIEVGIIEGEGAKLYEDAVTVLEVAIWNEFGTETIPERSFIRAWFDENREKCKAAVAAMTKAVIAGKYTKERALELLGLRFVAEIQRRMARGIPPPNAQSTIDAKGSDKPLIEKGQLRSSIKHRIKR